VSNQSWTNRSNRSRRAFHGRSTIDQVTLLTQHIKHSFSGKKKAGAVFADLTAAYDTVWHGGLTCKLLRLLTDWHTVHMIMEMVGNRSFTLVTGNRKRSRQRRLKRRPTGICPGTPSLQHLHLWPANHSLQKICICWRSSNHTLWWKLAGSGRGAEQGHGNCSWITPDLEAKALHYKNGGGILPY